MNRRFFFLLTAALLAGQFAWSNPDDQDSRIARLSYLEGKVSFQHASDADWSAASINFPMQPGDRVFTGSDGKAEIEFDDGSVFRLAENTDIELLSLRDDLIQLRIFSGLSTLSVAGKMEFEIDTPAAAFNTLRNGTYRFDVVENGDTDAIVREGELEAANNRFSRRIRQGELLHVEPGEYGLDHLSRYDRRDRWDDWNDRRDKEANAYGGGKYIPATVRIGASELGRYGRWVEIESYGYAWTPLRVDISWSPYSVGRWCYRPFWGWTWVSYEPWGWLPYHYGRWHRHARHGWCWIPGPAFAFNFWSPGLVVFYQGSGWISWGPLGPGDYYNIDSYHYNRRLHGHYLTQLRALHTRMAGDPFNRRVHGAFRTVEIDHFRNGVFGDRDRSPKWRNEAQPWRSGSLVRNRIDVRPTAASYSANPTRPAIRPARVNSLPAVVRSAPASRGGNHSRVAAISTPRGYSEIRPDRDRSRESRQGNVEPSTIWRVDRSGNRSNASDAGSQPQDRSRDSDRNEKRPGAGASPSDNRISRPQSAPSNQGSDRQNPPARRDDAGIRPRTNERSQGADSTQPQPGTKNPENEERNQSGQPDSRRARPRNNDNSQSNRILGPQSEFSDPGGVRQNPKTYQVPQTQYIKPRTVYVQPLKPSRPPDPEPKEVRTFSSRSQESAPATIKPLNANPNSRVDVSRFGGGSSVQAAPRSDPKSSGRESRNAENQNSSGSSDSSGGRHARSRR